MLIKTNKSDLMGCLKTAVRAVPQKTSTPILENVVLWVEDGEMKVIASDNIVSVLVRCPAEGAGTACLPARTLFDMVSSLPGTDFTITVEGVIATLDYGIGHSVMPAFPVEDFPEIKFPDADTNDGALVKGTQLREAVKRSLPNILLSGLRPQLGGVFFSSGNNGLECVASDSATLSVVPVPCYGIDRDFILPASAARLITATEWDDDVRIIPEKGCVYFCMGTVTLRAVDVVGKFPAYRTIIPTSHESSLTAGRADMLAALRRMKVCADRNTQHLVLNIDALGGLVMETRDLGNQRSAREQLRDVSYEGGEITIAFRADYLERILAEMGSERVYLFFNGPRKAVLITGEDEPGKYVIMPIMISK